MRRKKLCCGNSLDLCVVSSLFGEDFLFCAALIYRCRLCLCVHGRSCVKLTGPEGDYIDRSPAAGESDESRQGKGSKNLLAPGTASISLFSSLLQGALLGVVMGIAPLTMDDLASCSSAISAAVTCHHEILKVFSQPFMGKGQLLRRNADVEQIPLAAFLLSYCDPLPSPLCCLPRLQNCRFFFFVPSAQVSLLAL